jgi:cytochrome c
LAADVINTVDSDDATTNTEVKCEQNCSHRAFFRLWSVADLTSDLDVDNEHVGFCRADLRSGYDDLHTPSYGENLTIGCYRTERVGHCNSGNAEPNVVAGKAFALANCSPCHSIDKFTPSALAIAPPFRILHQRYPVESLEEALGEGISTGHPSMPEFRLDPGQVGDFISFLKSLEQ